MEMCRVCLSTEKEMLPLDETFINSYNLLTNLNITLLDGMPQYSCQSCLDTVKYFIEFREKSIISENTLRDIINSDIKIENKTHVIEIDKTPINSTNDNINCGAIKCEVKEENDDSMENIEGPFGEYDDVIRDLIVKKDEGDIKPENIRRKKNKKKRLKTTNFINSLTNGILENSWFCGICPKTFDNKSDLNNHLNIHKNDRQCDLCREELNSLSQLLAHRLMHVPIKQNKCHICEKRYRCCQYLEHHYRNVHIEGDDKNLSCKYCPLTFNLPKRLNSHMLQVHSSVKYFCDTCSKGFQSKVNLKSHIKSHSENKAYVCDMCGFSCKHSGGLKDHKIRRHAPKKVYCKNCKRPFSSQEQHDVHKCKNKLNVCPICGVQLNGNSRLSRHMMSHSDIPRYECTRCPAKYKSKAALIAHTDRHDGNKTKQCEWCPAKFYTTTVLIKHRRIHTGEKPYVCKVCNKGFTGNHNLKVHMKVHGEYLIVKKNSEQVNLTNVTN